MLPLLITALSAVIPVQRHGIAMGVMGIVITFWLGKLSFDETQDRVP